MISSLLYDPRNGFGMITNIPIDIFQEATMIAKATFGDKGMHK